MDRLLNRHSFLKIISRYAQYLIPSNKVLLDVDSLCTSPSARNRQQPKEDLQPLAIDMFRTWHNDSLHCVGLHSIIMACSACTNLQRSRLASLTGSHDDCFRKYNRILGIAS